MKNKILSAAVIAMAMVLSAGLTACGIVSDENKSENENISKKTQTVSETDQSWTEQETTKNEETTTKAPDPIDFSKIEWSVDTTIISNKRYAIISYTNNSEYPVSYLKIKFKEKEDVTQEMRNAYLDVVDELVTLLSDDDIAELKTKSISAKGESERMTMPGESDSQGRMYYYQGVFYMLSLDYFDECLEPDIAEIHYVADDKLVTAYYDFANKKVNVESETEPAYYWTTGALKDAVPKPDVIVVEKDFYDSDDKFCFKAEGMTPDGYEIYKQACTDAGFELFKSIFANGFGGQNKDGIYILMEYDEDNAEMSVESRKINN